MKKIKYDRPVVTPDTRTEEVCTLQKKTARKEVLLTGQSPEQIKAVG
jgi:hypothetical protein